MYDEVLDDFVGPSQLQNSSNSDSIAETHVIVLPFKPFLSLTFFFLILLIGDSLFPVPKAWNPSTILESTPFPYSWSGVKFWQSMYYPFSFHGSLLSAATLVKFFDPLIFEWYWWSPNWPSFSWFTHALIHSFFFFLTP